MIITKNVISVFFAVFITVFFPMQAFSSSSLLGGSPLSDTAPHWSPQHHSLNPSSSWGEVKKPLPTNIWWQNLTLGKGSNPVNVLPYEVKTLHDGLHVCLPNKVVGTNYVLSNFLNNIVLSAKEDLGEKRVASYDALSVTMEWSSGLVAPLVRGMPYATAFYGNLTPVIKTQHAILSVNHQSVNREITDTRFVIAMNNGQTWHLYSDSPITFYSTTSGLTSLKPFQGFLRVAVVTETNAQLLDAHSGTIPLGGEVTAITEADTAELSFDWHSISFGKEDLLMMSLPHHCDVLTNQQQPAITYNTIKGDMIGIVGKHWVMKESLTTIGWNAPKGIDLDRVEEVRSALYQDAEKRVVAKDPYFGGKQMAAIARLALIADELGETQIAESYRDTVAVKLNNWLAGSNTKPLVYDQTWGGVISSEGVSNPGAAFGNGYYNDHHFHYGYFVYAAAAIAKERPEWTEQWGDAVTHLIRNIAEPSGCDSYYTYMRNKDWFVGHSWASGLFEFGDSRNQESTSEAVNAWYSIYLYGLATNDARMRDLGRLLLATELRSVWRYWQITSDSSIYPAPFSDKKVVGVLWSTKVDYSTFFGNQIEFIYGIQMLPYTPITEELLRPEWIAEAQPIYSKAMNHSSISEGWRGFLIMADGVLDANEAWKKAMQLRNFDDGNSKTNTLYWLATRPN